VKPEASVSLIPKTFMGHELQPIQFNLKPYPLRTVITYSQLLEFSRGTSGS
jgi:hypothetical protein